MYTLLTCLVLSAFHFPSVVCGKRRNNKQKEKLIVRPREISKLSAIFTFEEILSYGIWHTPEKVEKNVHDI